MRIDIHIHHHLEPGVAQQLAQLNDNLERFMSDVDDFVSTVLAKVAAEKTQIDSLATLLSNIKHQLSEALRGENLSPGAKDKLAAIFPALEGNTAEISDAIAANTDPVPPAPTPVVDPVPEPVDPAPPEPQVPPGNPGSL